jgi:hypothetical protein
MVRNGGRGTDKRACDSARNWHVIVWQQTAERAMPSFGPAPLEARRVFVYLTFPNAMRRRVG